MGEFNLVIFEAMKYLVISCPVIKVVYGRGGFYQPLFGTTRYVVKPAPAAATDATGHDIKPAPTTQSFLKTIHLLLH
jgi:hypothetical protein